MPRGMRRAASQKAWLCALKEDPEVLGLRSDGYGNLMRVARDIAWHADWATLCSRPTRAGIAQRTGLHPDTVRRWVRWLRGRGWLGTVEEGSTARYRPRPRPNSHTVAGSLGDDGLGNRAAVWVLCVRRRGAAKPPGQRADQAERITAPPSVTPPGSNRRSHAHARDAPPPLP
ncbi:helix-turn-helix domain-containing protein (plasmid) [Nonomuraea sp. NBC_00507]|uniref:helix-turn-helix domain-containing protein n=1 Tax=Nonomuraea sp. NBC_00507 TaxID=2976002 RepID=UPI002E182F8C